MEISSSCRLRPGDNFDKLKRKWRFFYLFRRVTNRLLISLWIKLCRPAAVSHALAIFFPQNIYSVDNLAVGNSSLLFIHTFV